LCFQAETEDAEALFAPLDSRGAAMKIARWTWWLIAPLLTASSLAQAQELTRCATPGLVLNPNFKSHTLVPYPVLAKRNLEQGKSIFLVNIGTDGVPTDVTVELSDASQRMNDAAIAHLKSNWRWEPPMQDCQPTTAKANVQVMWSLVHVPPPSFPPSEFSVTMPPSAVPPGTHEKLEEVSRTLLEIETDELGAVKGGRVIDSGGFADLDGQALTILKNSPTLMKGQPAGKHVLSAIWPLPAPALPVRLETVIVTADPNR